MGFAFWKIREGMAGLEGRTGMVLGPVMWAW